MIATVCFGWLVKARASGIERGGAVGAMALEVASFPSTVKDVFLDLIGRASGGAPLESVRVRRDPAVDMAGLVTVPVGGGEPLPGLLMRADPTALPGWRIVFGAFATAEGVRNMAVTISSDLHVVHQLVLDEVPVDGAIPRTADRKFLHGAEVLPDGSLIFTFDGSVSLQRVDFCGNRKWAIPGAYSHSVTADDDGGSVWSLKSGDRLMRIAVADGRVEREITVQQIIDANPMIDILEILRIHANDLGDNSRNTSGRWLADNLHLNDVEPLPAALAAQFPEFAPGDLLISARSPNLIFVLDPQSLNVKWWLIGATERQHDPDWMAGGEILVYNNRMSRDFSEIAAIDPKTYARRTVFDGRQNDFYSRIRGKVERLPSGGFEVTSPQQGRAFEIDANGKVVLDLMNVVPGSEDMNLAISEVKWFPPNFFRPGTPCLDDFGKSVSSGG